jgi:hypothetical protein
MPSPLATPPLANISRQMATGVHQRVYESGCTQIGQQPASTADNGDAGGEIDDAGPEEQFRVD